MNKFPTICIFPPWPVIVGFQLFDLCLGIAWCNCPYRRRSFGARRFRKAATVRLLCDVQVGAERFDSVGTRRFHFLLLTIIKPLPGR
ncbi:hypothetical protein CALVIDRAFT_246329 [Calocera viscosa TUFC12733]|uniref:Uncharacterized protein n=1 Tax=Calocera viscosa (strain TUFC12733) TaxID=1330018 RepID=A0A167JII2_CALVF|nr:hypothetical protein CALVIDRAFT_246329 [Calocera viscosa TUFC12733]